MPDMRKLKWDWKQQQNSAVVINNENLFTNEIIHVSVSQAKSM